MQSTKFWSHIFRDVYVSKIPDDDELIKALAEIATNIIKIMDSLERRKAERERELAVARGRLLLLTREVGGEDPDHGLEVRGVRPEDQPD